MNADKQTSIVDPELENYYRGPLPDVFRIGEAAYRVDEFGVIHQQPPFTIKQYDVGYVSERYDVIPEAVGNMSHLRAGYLLGLCPGIRSVLDVGYGNGGFLKAIKAPGLRCVGTDISGYPVPEGCEFLPWEKAVEDSWGLVTFFDSLEHFPDLEVLGQLNTQWLAVTAPCVRPEATVDWLAGWKHLRPGEHLHHFTRTALTRWLATHGYGVRAVASLEDRIRPAVPGEWNTFTAVYQRG